VPWECMHIRPASPPRPPLGLASLQHTHTGCDYHTTRTDTGTLSHTQTHRHVQDITTVWGLLSSRAQLQCSSSPTHTLLPHTPTTPARRQRLPYPYI
jgi:hypothetical protein